jgi:hypothetical protein
MIIERIVIILLHKTQQGRFYVFCLRYSLPHNAKAKPCGLASEWFPFNTESRFRVFAELPETGKSEGDLM